VTNICNYAAVAYFKVLLRHTVGKQSEIATDLSKRRRFLGKHL